MLGLYILAAVLLGFLAAVGLAVMVVLDLTGVPSWAKYMASLAAGVALGAFAWWRRW